MRFQADAWDLYSVVQNKAKRAVRKATAKGMDTSLLTLEAILDKKKVAEEVDLGVLYIPVKQIAGTVSNGDEGAYTTDFLPLPSAQSEYAQKWTQIYMEHLSDAGLADPIRCYEYFGDFYVVDGKKRVSVLKAHGDMMVKAHVIRLMPVKSEEPKVRCYYEFVRTFEKTGLYQVAFSQAGRANRFLEALGYDADHVWDDADRFGFLFHWYPFERAHQIALGDSLNITTADALLVLLEKHSYAELRDMHSWILAELMQEAWLEMYQISNPGFTLCNTVERKAS